MHPLRNAPSNCPPRHAKRLSDAPIEGYAISHARAEILEAKDEQGAQYEPTPPPAVSPRDAQPQEQEQRPQSELQTSPSGLTDSDAMHPPQPCERCVRSRRDCRGSPGARCDNCKNLHQKCSNSSGPPRGRHASNAASILAVGEAGPSSWATRPKRKAVPKGKLVDGDDDEDIDEDSVGSELKTQPAQKKRRTTANDERRSRLLKEVSELESSVKRLQTTFVRDLTKLQQTAASLASQIRDLD